MHRYKDAAVTRMTVAIVSILAAKVPTGRMSKLMCANSHMYMQFLVHLVLDKVSQFNSHMLQGQDDPPPQPDVALKFTLSALWNLTDESPDTCRGFLCVGGLEAVLQILRYFPLQDIHTKVLGLLNNIAEVKELQKDLVTEDCLVLMMKLLSKKESVPDETELDVEYFTAGILANLGASRRWDIQPSWEECMSTLSEAVLNWRSPTKEMVAYRSFKPFFPLLESHDVPGVLLWALWAIRHVCARNKERYKEMFVIQGGKPAIESVIEFAKRESNESPDPSRQQLYQHVMSYASDVWELIWGSGKCSCRDCIDGLLVLEEVIAERVDFSMS